MIHGLWALCDFAEFLHFYTFASSRLCLHVALKRISVDTESAPRSHIRPWVSPGTVVVNLESAFEGQR